MSEKIKDLEWQIAVKTDEIIEQKVKLEQLRSELAAEVSKYKVGDIVEKAEGYRSGKFVIEGFKLGSKIGTKYGVYLVVIKLNKNGKKSKLTYEIYVSFHDDEYNKVGVYNE